MMGLRWSWEATPAAGRCRRSAEAGARLLFQATVVAMWVVRLFCYL